jgi:hypothetical protein
MPIWRLSVCRTCHFFGPRAAVRLAPPHFSRHRTSFHHERFTRGHHMVSRLLRSNQKEGLGGPRGPTGRGQGFRGGFRAPHASAKRQFFGRRHRPGTRRENGTDRAHIHEKTAGQGRSLRAPRGQEAPHAGAGLARLRLYDPRHTYYHAGDNDFLASMFGIRCDVEFLPVGGHYTTGVEDEARAGEPCGAEATLPIHCGEPQGTEKDIAHLRDILPRRARERGLTLASTSFGADILGPSQFLVSG